MPQTGPKSRRKGHSGGGLGHLARRLKIATRAKSAANGLNCTGIPSKRKFWRGSGPPGQESENGHQGQICSKWPALGRNLIEKIILEGFWGTWPGGWAPGQEAENCHQGQICSKWPELCRSPELFWSTWPGGWKWPPRPNLHPNWAVIAGRIRAYERVAWCRENTAKHNTFDLPLDKLTISNLFPEAWKSL